MQAGGKQTTQIVILIVLLAGLGFSAFHMWRQFSPRPAKKAPATTTVASTQPAGANVPAPPKGGAANVQPPAGSAKAPEATAVPTLPMLPNGEVNGDLFRVYALQPPKNPFLQKEAWYQDELKKIPGYPELRDQGYFETMAPEFPDIAKTFGADKKWDSIMLKRETAPDINLEGESKDGKIRTSIALKESLPKSYELTWTPESGIPLSALKDPNFVRANADKLMSGAEAGAAPAAGGGLAVPASGELPEGLGIPGETSDATSTGLTTGTAKGDALACVGVNLKGDKATALIHYNGVPYLVSAGSVLPTHYQVMEIKEDGVVLLELRDGSSKWVPLVQAPITNSTRQTPSVAYKAEPQEPRTDNLICSVDSDYEFEKQKDDSLKGTYQYNVVIDCSGDPSSGIWWYDLYLYDSAGAVIGHLQGEVDFSMGRSQSVRKTVKTTERVADKKVIWGQGTQRVRPD